MVSLSVGDLCEGVDALAPLAVGGQKSTADRLPVTLIDSRSLTREALIVLLERTKRFDVNPVSTATQLLDEDAVAAGSVVLFNLGFGSVTDQAVRDDIASLRAGVGTVPVLIIAESSAPEDVAEALKLGVRGYVPTTQSSRILFEALSLVHAGGTFVPADVVAHALNQQHPPQRAETAAGEERVHLHGLTPRQQQVFELLRQGKPNKVIAHELSLHESTVKVHVRQIMRKLRASNRTQVAFIAACDAKVPYHGHS